MEKSNRKIFGNIDLIKVIASFSVTAVHFRNRVERNIPVELIGRKVQLFFSLDYALFIFAVPLFILVTGFLSTFKKDDNKHFITILKTYLMYMFMALVSYKFMVFLGIRDNLPLGTMIKEAMMFNLISGWYIELYLGLVLFMPYLNIISDSLSKEAFKRMIFVLILVSSIPSFINKYPFTSRFIYLPNFYKNLYPIIYYFIGSYIRRHINFDTIRVKKFALMYLVSLVSITMILFTYANPYTYTADGYYASILNVILATSFFIYIYFKTQNFNSSIISYISKFTLGTYIMSLPIDRIVYPKLASYFGGYHKLIVYSPLIVIILYLLTFITGMMLTKIFNGIWNMLQRIVTSER